MRPRILAAPRFLVLLPVLLLVGACAEMPLPDLVAADPQGAYDGACILEGAYLGSDNPDPRILAQVLALDEVANQALIRYHATPDAVSSRAANVAVMQLADFLTANTVL